MANSIPGKDISPTLDAAQQWVRTCLILDGSLFGDDSIWTAANLEEFTRAFIDHPDEGDDNFQTKLLNQLKDCSQPAKLLTAELMWVLLLFPTNINTETKRQQLLELTTWAGQPLTEHPLLTDSVLAGIGSAGTAYNAQRWRELAYLLQLAGHAKTLPTSDRQRLVSDYDSFLKWIEEVPTIGKRQLGHVLRYLLFSQRVEPMASNSDRRWI